MKSNIEEQINQISTEINAEKKEQTTLNHNIHIQKDDEDSTVSTRVTPYEITTTTEDTVPTEDLQKSMQIDQVVNQLLEALNEDNTPTNQEEKQDHQPIPQLRRRPSGQ